MDVNWAAVFISPALVGLVLLAAIVWDRCRAPYRDPRRVMSVVDRRTYREAMGRVDRLDLTIEDDRRIAIGMLVAARLWLRGELRNGWRSRAPWCAAQIRAVEIKLLELGAPEGLYS